MTTLKNTVALFLAVLLFVIPNLSCSETENSQTDAAPDYSFFTPISTEYPAIDNPTVAWTYHWPENNNIILETRTAPCADNQGNCYFVGRNGYLYSVDSDGETRWIIESFRGGKVAFFNSVIPKDKIIVTEEGLLVLSGKMRFISLEGEPIWEKENCTKDFYMSPDGTLFCFTNDDKLIGVDAKGQTMWSIDVSKNCLIDDGFFDTNSNGYFFVVDVGSISTEPEYHLLKASSTGEVVWKKNLPLNRLDCILSFLPNNIVQDTFLLAYTTLPYPEKDHEVKGYNDRKNQAEKIVKAYDLNYELLWEKSIPASGVYQGNYAIDKENNFYTYFNEYDYSGKHSTFTQSYLTCYSNDGSQMWEKTYDNEIAHCPVIDQKNNLYLWLNDSDYHMRSLTSDGVPRWKLEVDHTHG
ncbi:MAG: PQQ-like beta-propeller repeat protein, partial [Caldisericia bacterium]|nr:PQQ-like beta-propeller repeat protein [Caldisericia bacterium]